MPSFFEVLDSERLRLRLEAGYYDEWTRVDKIATSSGTPEIVIGSV